VAPGTLPGVSTQHLWSRKILSMEACRAFSMDVRFALNNIVMALGAKAKNYKAHQHERCDCLNSAQSRPKGISCRCFLTESHGRRCS